VDDFDDSVLTESPESFSSLQVVEHGKDLTLLTVGNKYAAAKQAVERLRSEGVDAGLVNLRYLKPLAEKALLEIMSTTNLLVTVEEYVRDGGVGSAIIELATDNQLTKEFLRIALPTTFIEPGSNQELENKYGLDGDGIYHQIRQRWENL